MKAEFHAKTIPYHGDSGQLLQINIQLDGDRYSRIVYVDIDKRGHCDYVELCGSLKKLVEQTDELIVSKLRGN